MIVGYFDSEGTPWLDGRVIIERLSVDGPVRFLVDTGADSGALHSADGKVLACRFDLLDEAMAYSVGGIGGSHDYFPEEALILFEGDDGTYEFAVDLDVARPTAVADELPSLLGRDILNDFRIEYDYGSNILHFHLSV